MLEAGEYNINFQLPIPYQVPTSFEYSGQGSCHVRHYCEALMIVPVLIDKKCVQPYSVISPVDLNMEKMAEVVNY